MLDFQYSKGFLVENHADLSCQQSREKETLGQFEHNAFGVRQGIWLYCVFKHINIHLECDTLLCSGEIFPRSQALAYHAILEEMLEDFESRNWTKLLIAELLLASTGHRVVSDVVGVEHASHPLHCNRGVSEVGPTVSYVHELPPWRCSPVVSV